MLIDIKPRINLNVLNGAIEHFKNTLNYTSDNYLIMNENTAMDLREFSKALSDYCISNRDTGKVEEYRGFKIAYCSHLRYGEVEIR